jgi:phytoene dehydrogenase-like protein
VANLGPHAIYTDGTVWEFCTGRGILPRVSAPPWSGLRFFLEGAVRRIPPLALARAVRLGRTEAPVDVSFREWATGRWNARTARILSGAAGVFAFHGDPGSLSAAFVVERLGRVYRMPPRARFVRTGWTMLVDALAGHARAVGVDIRTGHRLDALPEAPVVVATELHSAARLLGDESLRADGATAVLLDVALRPRRGDPYLVSDLDGGAWIERFSASDPTLCPDGQQMVQAQAGLREGESTEQGLKRLGLILDAAFPGWRERTVWSRDARISNLTGALDLPGRSWRDRPAIDRGNGVFLAGDAVAAPGLLGEVALNSAITAGHAAATVALKAGSTAKL